MTAKGAQVSAGLLRWAAVPWQRMGAGFAMPRDAAGFHRPRRRADLADQLREIDRDNGPDIPPQH
jgi:hypothetical protein